MDKQCLDVQQMQHLQKLGLDTSNASMYWISYNGVSVSIPSNFHLPTSDNDYVICDAYTLKDVLDALPEYIYDSIEQYLLEINMFYKYIRYSRFNDVLTKRNFDRTPIIDAAYELLVWCVENKFVETNKNE